MRPGVEIVNTDAPPVRGAPTSNSWFVVGITEKGPTNVATLIQSIGDFQRVYGSRVSYSSVLYDAVDVYFREGGDKVYVGRLVGPAPVVATHNFAGGSGTALTVNAKNPGTWGNNLKVQVTVTGGTYKLIVTDATTNAVLDSSPDLADRAAGVAWSTSSSVVDVVAGGTGSDNPVAVAATALAGGADDRTNIVEGGWTAAYNLFPADLGPGRVSAPGHTTNAGLIALATAAEATDRVAIGDLPDTSSVSTLTGVAAAVRATDSADIISLWAPWVTAPGTVPGTTRTVPYSGAQAALEARRDATGRLNDVAAFTKYPFRYVNGFSQTYSDSDRELLLDAGVDVGKNYFGGLVSWAYRTAADSATVPVYWQFNHANLRMGITARAKRIGGAFVGEQIDALGHTTGRFADALKGMLLEFYNQDALYGNLADDGNLPFVVDVGPSVNTTATVSAGELHAVIGVRMSYHAELVHIDIVTVPNTTSL